LDVPSYHKTLFVTDAAMNFQPDLETKIDILQNAIDMMLTLEVVNPKVAILSAVESVNPGIPSTLDAAALCKMVDRGQIPEPSSMAHSHSIMPFQATPHGSRRSNRRSRETRIF